MPERTDTNKLSRRPPSSRRRGSGIPPSVRKRGALAEASDVGVLDIDMKADIAKYDAVRKTVLVEIFQLFGLPSSSVEVRKKKIRIVIDIPFEPDASELEALAKALGRRDDPWDDPNYAKDPK